MSNLEQQLFRNLKGNNPSLVENNNFNNLSPPLLINLFSNIGGFNLLSNNNNSSLKGLDLNITVLVNALTEMNLMEEHYLKEGSFIKSIKFKRTEIENLNEQLERFNKIVEVNQWTEYRRFQIIEEYLVRIAARWYDEIKA